MIYRKVSATLLAFILLSGCSSSPPAFVKDDTSTPISSFVETEATTTIPLETPTEDEAITGSTDVSTEALPTEEPAFSESSIETEARQETPASSEPEQIESERPADNPDGGTPSQPPTEPAPPLVSQPPIEAPSESPTEAPSEPQTEPPTEAPTEPETESPSEQPAAEIDISALETYGNQYAASLGFEIDYSMNTGNSGYFPPNSAILYSMADGYKLVSEQVTVTYNYLMAYVGNIDGARARVLVTKDSNGWYTCTVLYG